MKKFTWEQLGKAINRLPVEQKRKRVMVSIEDESVFRSVVGLETIPEDVYVNKEDFEDCGELEELREAYGKDFNKKEYRLATRKGTPFLWDGF